MKYVSCAQMRELDRRAIEDIGIPGIVLMENAAVRFVDVFLNCYSPVKGKKITVVCGSGNNGGDGFAVARHLYNRNAKVTVLYTGKGKPKGDAGINYSAALNMGIKIINSAADDPRKYTYHISSSFIVIDAVFGTGLSRSVEGIYADLFKAVSHGKHVMSVDIPSGLDCDTGKPLGTAVRAEHTVTFGFLKKGFKESGARKYTGKITCVDISLPKGRNPKH
ncbi:NAD(P)H-hydrate epimerase [Planctomycetota bacterium]